MCKHILKVVYVFASALLFVLIVSIDLFACGLAYGTTGVKVSFQKIVVINLVGKVLVGSALFAGYYLGEIIPELVGIWVGFSVLVILGLVKVIQSVFKKNNAQILGLSWREAIVLGIVMSCDGSAMAFGTIVSDMPFAFIFVVLGMMLVTDQIVFLGANRLGFYLTQKNRTKNLNLDWLAGIILIVVAIVKLSFELLA